MTHRLDPLARPEPEPPCASRNYADRFPALPFRRWQGQHVSTVGLGPCRERGHDHAASMLAAVAAGCNVLDMAPHPDQDGYERCLGEAIRSAAGQGIGARAALAINATVGLVSDLMVHTIRRHGFARLKHLVEQRYVRPGLFGWHELAASCYTLSPGYLRYSIEQTLARAGLDYLDCVFVDHPEIHRRTASPAEFHRRLVAAFATLEQLCCEGTIRGYGIASPEPVALDELLALARTAAGGAPRLSALRVPYSLLRPEMWPLVKEASARGLHVFATGCLDGGTPQYQIPDELDEQLGELNDPAIAIRWVQSAPGVGTAVFGSRDRRHIRANLAAARLPRLPSALYRAAHPEEEAAA
ncbi:MAG: aldo/keto reductase [Deltaproteobacteria bacterium]|nr:aldo/keto reductase [Deltaproteobacteria bacterium]